MASEGHLITSAPRGRTLDIDERNRRYTITMLIRTACFLLLLVVPGWWKLVALVGAAVLPVIAVVLANGKDQHVPAPFKETEEPDMTRPMLTSGEVIRGTVEDE